MGNMRDFDKAAPSWDQEPRRAKLARDVAEAIRREIDLKTTMDLLDYGCGTGLVTLELQPFVRSVTGADTSNGMLEELRKKVAERHLTNVSVHLVAPERIGIERKFHLIVSSMTLHHVADLPALFSSFHGLLHPGGMICLADLDTEGGEFHDDNTGVLHFGFDRRDLQRVLESCGFREVHAVTAAVVPKERHGKVREFTVFLMTART